MRVPLGTGATILCVHNYLILIVSLHTSPLKCEVQRRLVRRASFHNLGCGSPEGSKLDKGKVGGEMSRRVLCAMVGRKTQIGERGKKASEIGKNTYTRRKKDMKWSAHF